MNQERVSNMSLNQERPKIKKYKAKNHLVDGAIAGFVSAFMIQPLQVIKTAMQIKPVEREVKTKSELMHEERQKLKNRAGKYDMLNFREATKVVYEREGLKGYYRGFVPSMIKATLSSATFF